MSRGSGLRSAAAALLVACPLAAGAGGYEEVVLDNGLRVVLVEQRGKRTVSSSVVVGAGVVYEPEGMNGASHLLEHLLFNGTETRTQRQIYDEADRLGAYNNATTREDHTLFTLFVASEFAKQGLDLQADMLFRSTLPAEKFDKEKGIVLEELARDRSDPAYLAEEAFRAFAYAGTPLSRPVLGSEASIRDMTRAAVLAYYRARYVPTNMTLVVMGDFEIPRMMEAVRGTFGAAERRPAPRSPASSWPAPPERNLATSPLEAGRAYLHAAFPLPLEPHEPGIRAAEVLLSALADGKESPLSRALTSGPDPLVLSFSLGVSPRQVPWSTVEFEAVLPPGREPSEVLGRFGEGVLSLRPGSAAWDRIAEAAAAASADEALTADEMRNYGVTRAATWTGSPRGFIARRLRSSAVEGGLPLEETAALLREGIPRVRASAAGPGIAAATATWKPSSPRVETPASPPSRAETLPSGVRAWVERSEDSPVFAVHVLLAPRSASEPAGKEGIADFLHRMLLRGTVVRDAASLSAALGSLGARIKSVDDPSIPYDDYYTTPEYSFVRLEMPGERWREGVALLGEVLRFPALADEDVEAVRREMLDLQKRRLESPRSVAADLVARTLAPGHPLSKPVLGTPETVASITAADLAAFHRDYVSGRRMIVTAVGPADPAEVLAALGAALRGVPPGPDVPSPGKPPVTPSGLSAEGAVGKGQAQVVLSCLFDADPADRPALALAGALLSDRLAFRLREEKGLAYAISATVAPYGGRMKLEAAMGTRQANVGEAIEGLRGGIAGFASEPPDAAAVERAANALRGRMIMRRLSRIGQAFLAGTELLEGRRPGDDLSRIDALGAVPAADVARVARRYLAPARCATITVR